jgi:hypothetical protein
MWWALLVAAGGADGHRGSAPVDIVLFVMALVKHYRPEPLALRHLPPVGG